MRCAGHLIGGRHYGTVRSRTAAAPDDPSYFDRHDPSTGAPVGSVAVAGRAEVEQAVAAARAASHRWARTAPGARAAAVRDAALRLDAAAEDLAQLVTEEMGRPLGQAREGVAAGRAALEQYAELGPLHRGRSLQGEWAATDLMVPGPLGVVAVITPWNDPVAVACTLLGAALVTGNTVVFKPSERAPFSGARLGTLLAEAVPAGVVNLLSGDASTGARLAAHPDLDLIAHVGSTATGRSIARAAAARPTAVLLENGGKDPLLVDADVDPDWAAEQAVAGCFTNAGQLCTAVERVYVHTAVAERFVDALTTAALGTTVGPLVDRVQRDVVHRHVRDAQRRGARIMCGGEVPDGPGAHYPPTVLLGCNHEMAVMREETFGPVAPVTVVDSFDEGLDLAGAGEYGLAATVLTGSMAHAQAAWRDLPVGTVKVNAVFGGAPGGAAEPRRHSGQGFGYGPELLDEMTATKVVHLALPGPCPP